MRRVCNIFRFGSGFRPYSISKNIKEFDRGEYELETERERKEELRDEEDDNEEKEEE